MTDPWSTERYHALAEAYGGTIARWPPAERAAAARWATTPDGARVLAEADALDRRLDLWSVSTASEALTTRIVARAPAHPPLRARARWWWSGAGMAAALAGVAAGTTAAALVGAPRDMSVEGATAFGDLGPAEEDS